MLDTLARTLHSSSHNCVRPLGKRNRESHNEMEACQHPERADSAKTEQEVPHQLSTNLRRTEHELKDEITPSNLGFSDLLDSFSLASFVRSPLVICPTASRDVSKHKTSGFVFA